MVRPWADQPFALQSTELGMEAEEDTKLVSAGMTLVHNLIIRYLNSIYLQANGVSPDKNIQDVEDFIFYCQSFCDFVHHHHENEESIVFPKMDELAGEKDVMGDSVEQHRQFEGGFNVFCEHIKTVKADEYSGAKIKELIDNFAQPLIDHLADEPVALIHLGNKIGGEKLKKAWDDAEKELLEEGLKLWDNHIVLPNIAGTMDKDFEGGKWAWWPTFPWFMPYLIKFFYWRRHAGAWRFYPCYDFKRQELPFVGPEYEQA